MERHRETSTGISDTERRNAVCKEKIRVELNQLIKGATQEQERRRAICRECGGDREVVRVFMELGEKKVPCPLCEPSNYRDAMEKVTLERERRRAERVEEKLCAEVGREFRDKVLDGGPSKGFEERTPQAAKAKAAVRRYLANLKRNVENGEGLAIFGPVKAGKTHLVVALKKEAEKQGVVFTMVNYLKMIFECKKAISSPGEDSIGVIERYAQIPCLIIDDLMVGRNTSEWVAEITHYLIDERYIHNRPTIITSNHEPSDFGEMFGIYGARIESRIAEGRMNSEPPIWMGRLADDHGERNGRGDMPL